MSYPQQPGNWSDPSWPQQQQQQQQPYDPYNDPYSGPPAGYPGSPAPAAYPAYGYGAPPLASQHTNGMAIASMVLSLCGLLCGVTAPIGAILGHVARRQIRERGEGGDGMALAGIIVGWIITALSIIGIIAYVALLAWVIQQAPSTTY